MSEALSNPSSSMIWADVFDSIPLSKNNLSRIVNVGTRSLWTVDQSVEPNGHDDMLILSRNSLLSLRDTTAPVIDSICSPSAYRIIERGQKKVLPVTGSAFSAAAPNALEIATGSPSLVMFRGEVSDGKNSPIRFFRFLNCASCFSVAKGCLAPRGSGSRRSFG